MEKIGERLRKYWVRDGVAFRPGAPGAAISAFETTHEVQLPADLRDYLATVDGFTPGTMDENCFEFLSLDEIKTLKDWWRSPDARSYFILVDFLISSHVYAIKLHQDARPENPVVVCYDNEPIKIADSFTEFAEGYLKGHETILGF